MPKLKCFLSKDLLKQWIHWQIVAHCKPTNINYSSIPDNILGRKLKSIIAKKCN